MKQNRLIISKYLHYAWLRFHVLHEKKEEEEEDKKKTENRCFLNLERKRDN